MEIMKDRYSITELSNRLNVTDHALRYYEKEFSLNIPKDERGRRYYTPENANIMYQIKAMRDEGLEIKAIRKIFQTENIIKEPPPVVIEDDGTSLVKQESKETAASIKQFFDEFSEQITNSVSTEVGTAREYLLKEINKSKLELGACVENNFRKLESKMERHFQEVDRSLGDWRVKSKQNFFTRLLKKEAK